jgi:hypothetical protein
MSAAKAERAGVVEVVDPHGLHVDAVRGHRVVDLLARDDGLCDLARVERLGDDDEVRVVWSRHTLGRGVRPALENASMRALALSREIRRKGVVQRGGRC